MRHLDAFLALLCGRFDNARQLEELKQTRPGYSISVDGGVNPGNAARLRDAGAEILICGSSVFDGNIEENMTKLLKAL